MLGQWPSSVGWIYGRTDIDTKPDVSLVSTPQKQRVEHGITGLLKFWSTGSLTKYQGVPEQDPETLVSNSWTNIPQFPYAIGL